MKILSFIVAMLIMLPSTPDGGRNYWDTLLDKYEALCNACKEKKSKKEIQQLSESLNEHLKHPEGKMTPVQKERFASIQNRYRGVITISDRTVPEVDPPRLIKVDTVRRYEHIHVTDTVFVKEIIGSIELNQYVHNKDTVYHIVQYQTPPAVEKPQQETPEPVILAIPATKQVTGSEGKGRSGTPYSSTRPTSLWPIPPSAAPFPMEPPWESSTNGAATPASTATSTTSLRVIPAPLMA